MCRVGMPYNPASHRDSSALLDAQCNWKILPCSRCQLDIPYKIRLGLVHTFPDDSYGNGWNWQR